MISPVGPDVNEGEPGGVTSTVIVPVALAPDEGPVLPAASVTAPGARARPRVPLVGDPAVSVTV